MNVSPSEISIDCIYFLVCLYEKPPFQDFSLFSSLSLTRHAMSYPKGLASSRRMHVKLVSCFLKRDFSFQKNQWSHCDTFPGD